MLNILNVLVNENDFRHLHTFLVYERDSTYQSYCNIDNAYKKELFV